MEIIPGIHLVDGIFAHCYLIDGPKLTLIDTGMPRKTKKIIRYITETLQRTPTDLKTIVLTHSDIDHIGNARELQNITGAVIAAHSLDAEVIAGKKSRQTPQKILGFFFKTLGVILQVKPFPVDKIIDHGDRIAGLTVLHLPDHTPGSIALYDPIRKVLFVGDTLGCKEGIVQGPPKSVTWDMKQAYHSIQRLRTLDFAVMLSGHGEPVSSDASAKVQQFLTTIQEKNKTI